jgi:hypothetical protein
MITLSYGMTKSGSTLSFELAKSILHESGFIQRRLPLTIIEPGHNVNFIGKVTIEKLKVLLAEVSDSEHIVVKTHSWLDFPTQVFLESLVLKNKIKIHATYRDPREVCLSLIDHGIKSRNEGVKPFSTIFNLDDAIKVTSRELENFQKWGAIKGSVIIKYDDVAFSTEKTISQLEQNYKLSLNSSQITTVKNYVFNQAFTQKNKAIPKRYEQDMPKQDQDRIKELFSSFFNFLEHNDTSWFLESTLSTFEKIHVMKTSSMFVQIYFKDSEGGFGILSNDLDIQSLCDQSKTITFYFELDHIKKELEMKKSPQNQDSRRKNFIARLRYVIGKLKKNKYTLSLNQENIFEIVPQSETYDQRKYVYFSGGLGDVIRALYTKKGYILLNNAQKPIAIVLASHNPFTKEIFLFHANFRRFILIDVSISYETLFAKGFRGDDLTAQIKKSIPYGVNSCIGTEQHKNPKRIFTAPDTLEILNFEKYVIFQPFAGGNARNIPCNLIIEILETLDKRKIKTFILMRSFVRTDFKGKLIHDDEKLNSTINLSKYSQVKLLNNLSVPATLQLLQNSKGCIGSWSSLHQAAWFEKKPVAVYYPPKYIDVEKRTGYAFGLDYADTIHADFSSFDLEQFEKWLDLIMTDNSTVKFDAVK